MIRILDTKTLQVLLVNDGTADPSGRVCRWLDAELIIARPISLLVEEWRRSWISLALSARAICGDSRAAVRIRRLFHLSVSQTGGFGRKKVENRGIG